MRAMRFLAAIGFALLFIPAALAQGPTVYISGEGGTYSSAHSVATHNETMEMARTLLKSCPEVSLTVAKDDAKVEYLMLLNRQEAHAFGSAISQVMVLRPDQSVMFASREGTVARATKESCKAIMADWKDRRPRTAQSTDPKSNWNITKP
jgi:hypothetical protein